MIIVNLKGGLGNQMFQYAFGRTLSLKNNTVLKLDTSTLVRATEIGNIPRSFDISNFNLNAELANKLEVENIRYPFGLISKVQDLIKKKLLRQFNIVFDKNKLELKDNQYLDGFWQSPKYFEAIRDVLINDFTLKAPLSTEAFAVAQAITKANSISIHIRRGDYINNQRVLNEYGICSIDYYKNALELINQKTSSPTYFVFSDDIKWAKANLPLPQDTVFIKDSNISTAEELVLMSKCQHNIIANSSFSWWAAWLNQNPQKIVIAPTPWFDKVKYDKNLIPSTWIQLAK